MTTPREHLERLTKPQLVQEIEKVQRQVADAAPSRVDEATALAGCIRALDAMLERERANSRNGSNYPMQFSGGFGPPYDPAADPYRHQDSTERILRLLAAKYSVPLVEKRTEPCSRPHLDTVTPDALMHALHSATGGIR